MFQILMVEDDMDLNRTVCTLVDGRSEKMTNRNSKKCGICFITDTALFMVYRTKEVLRVVDQASPGFRTAAAGFSSQLVPLPS